MLLFYILLRGGGGSTQPRVRGGTFLRPKTVAASADFDNLLAGTLTFGFLNRWNILNSKRPCPSTVDDIIC